MNQFFNKFGIRKKDTTKHYIIFSYIFVYIFEENIKKNEDEKKIKRIKK